MMLDDLKADYQLPKFVNSQGTIADIKNTIKILFKDAASNYDINAYMAAYFSVPRNSTQDYIDDSFAAVLRLIELFQDNYRWLNIHAIWVKDIDKYGNQKIIVGTVSNSLLTRRDDQINPSCFLHDMVSYWQKFFNPNAEILLSFISDIMNFVPSMTFTMGHSQIEDVISNFSDTINKLNKEPKFKEYGFMKIPVGIYINHNYQI